MSECQILFLQLIQSWFTMRRALLVSDGFPTELCGDRRSKRLARYCNLTFSAAAGHQLACRGPGFGALR